MQYDVQVDRLKLRELRILPGGHAGREHGKGR